jgi:hypothetical protein
MLYCNNNLFLVSYPLYIILMLEALKIILFFKKPSWDNDRPTYIFFGILAWLEILTILFSLF